MSDSMVERVARILCDRECEDPDRIVVGEGKAIGTTWTGWQAYASEAREIIAAMREPTEWMAAEAVLPAMSRDGERVWRTMIDAALAEV